MSFSIGPLELLATGFSFIEGPRWHDGALYVTHIHDDAIDKVDLDGTVTRVVELPSSPISIGFASDGSMLISSLSAGKLWRYSREGLSEVADLAALSPYHWGDIVIDAEDRVYIANQGMAWPDLLPATWDSQIFLITSSEAPVQLAGGFAYANGLAITPDGRTLVIAESFGHRILSAPINLDGTIGEPILVCQLDETQNPDGICCDASGAVWVANATGRTVVRCTLDGEITHTLPTGDDLAIGCMLGGDDGRDLFVTTAPTALRDEARATRGAALWRTRVDVQAGGRP